MLLNYTKKELEQLAKIYEVKGGYKLKKAELIEILLEMIPENMDKALVNLDTKDLEAFEAIIKEEKWIDNIEEATEYLNLKAVGLIEIFNEEDKVKVEVEPCIKEAYEKLDTRAIRERGKRNSHLKTHILGILNLYGAVELAWVEKLYNKDNEDQVDVQDMISFIEADRELASRVRISHGYIADETVYAVDENNFSAFIKATESKPYYVPTKEYIALISDDDYYDNTLQVQKLKSYIKKHFTQQEEMIEEAVMAVTMIARVDCSVDGATTDLMLEEWSYMGIDITNPVLIKEVTEHILAVADTTRKWINRGFTNDELRPTMTTQQPVVRKLDVGRNAACPCGSGKKYKKCCGRNK